MAINRLFDFPGLLLIGLTIIFFLAAEIGVRLGRVEESEQVRSSEFSAMQGMILGLLGLMLGFTFAMALSRFDLRRQLVVDEANAISTTDLRTAFFPEPYRSTLHGELRTFVDLRLAFFGAGNNPRLLGQSVAQAAELEQHIWAEALTAAQNRRDPLIGLFFQSLNEMIDLDAKRLAALENRIPLVIWLVLIAISLLACYIGGYSQHHLRTISLLLTPLVIALVLALIADLDSPRRGLIMVSQRSMQRLQLSLEMPDAPPIGRALTDAQK